MQPNNPYQSQARQLKDAATQTGALKQIEALRHVYPESFDEIIKCPYLLIQSLQRSLCMLYKGRVRRSIDSDSKETETLLREVEHEFDGVGVDELTFITGTSALKVHYDADDDKLYLLPLGSDYLDADSSPTNPLKLTSLEISYMHSNVEQKEVWTAKEMSRKIDGSKTKTATNPYGFLPFVLFHNRKPGIATKSPLFSEPPIALLNLQLALSALSTYRHQLAQYQTNSFLVISGKLDPRVADKIDTSINGVLNLPDPTGTANYKNPQTPIEHITQVITAQIAEVSQMFGIDQTNGWNTRSSVRSGVQLMASKKGLYDFLAARSKQFITPETELFEKAIRILAHHRNIKLPDFKVRIEHLLPTAPIENDELAELDFKLTHHLITPVDILIERNPRLSREEAEKIIEQNRQANTRLPEPEIP